MGALRRRWALAAGARHRSHRRHGLGPLPTLGLMAAGLALLAVFVVIEGRFATQPLMPLRIFSSRTLTAANVVVLLLGAAVFAMWFFLSLYLQQVRGFSPFRAGLAFLPMTLCIVVSSTLVSRVVTRIGPKPLLVAGMTMEAMGLLLFTQLSAKGTYVGEILVPSLLVAIGLGFAFVPVTIAAVAGVDHEEAGLASGGEYLALVRRCFRPGCPGRARHLADQPRPAPRGEQRGGDARGPDQRFPVGVPDPALFAAIGAAIALFGLPRVATTRRPSSRASTRLWPQGIATRGKHPSALGLPPHEARRGRYRHELDAAADRRDRGRSGHRRASSGAPP